MTMFQKLILIILLTPLLASSPAVTQTIISFKSQQTYNAGDLYLHLSIPYINGFYFQPENEPNEKTKLGYFGLTLGLDYYHSNRQFLNFSASAVADLPVPFPVAVDYFGEYEAMQSVYLSLSNNHIIKRFTIGYGLSYGKNLWALRYDARFGPPPPTREPVEKSNSFLGLVIPAYFKWGRHFNIGLIYRPTLVRFNTESKYEYEHLISIDLAWKRKL